MARADQRIKLRQEERRKTKQFRQSAKYWERQDREEREQQERHYHEAAVVTEIIGLLKKLPAEDFTHIRELMGAATVVWQVANWLKEDAST